MDRGPIMEPQKAAHPPDHFVTECLENERETRNTPLEHRSIMGKLGERACENATYLLVCCAVSPETPSSEANPEHAPPFGSAPRVDRLGPDTIEIHWDAGPACEVLVCNRPTTTAASTASSVGTLRREALRLQGYPRHRLVYFLLRPEDSRPHRWVAERRLALDGQPNLRDLGGYEAADGRTIRWGRLFRSGALAGLSPADQDMLQSLGIQIVCDFRSPLEREREPHEFLSPAAPEQIAVSREQLAGALQPDDIRERMASGNFDDLEIDTLLVDGNEAFATTHRSPFRNMIQIVCESGDGPILVN